MFIVELYGSWEGRIGRLMHVGGLLALTLVYEIILLIIGHPGITGHWGPLQLILALVVIYPSWVVSVKRAHDLGKSGWWLFGWSIAGLPAIILIGIGMMMSSAGNSGGAIVFFLAAVVLSLASLWQIVIKLFFFAGQPGDNQFGPLPRPLSGLLGDDDTAPAHMTPPAPSAPRSARPAMATMQKVAAVAPAPALRRAAAPAKPTGFGRRGPKPA